METERRRRQNDGEERHGLFLLLSGSADLRLGRTANLLLPDRKERNRVILGAELETIG